MSLPTPRPDRRSIHPSKRAALVRRIDVGWQNHALCAKFPADDWFPAPSDSEAVADLVQVCRRCPAQVSCLAAALAMGEEHGIWGGTTEEARYRAVHALGCIASVPDVLNDLLTAHETHDTGTDDRDRGAAA